MNSTHTQEISSWLNSPEKNWDDGILLLSAHGNRPRLIRTLTARGYNAKNLNDLIYELNKISNQSSPAFTKPPVKENKIVKSRLSFQKPGEQSDDPILVDLHNKKNKLFKEYVAIHHQLQYMPKKQRLIAALHCLHIWKTIRDLWKQIDYYVKYKQEMPSVTNASISSDHVNIMRRLLTLRTYITKYEKKLQSVTTESSREKWQRKLDEFHAEKQDIERRLKV